MMKALVGSRPNVTGSRTATVSAGPIPGSMPTAVPRVTPANAHARCGSVSALAKPDARAARVSVTLLSHPALEHAGRQCDIEYARKEDVGPGRQRHRHECIANRMTRVERARGEPEQHRGGDDEAGR